MIGSNRDESALFFKSSQDGHYTESQLDGYMEWAYSKPGQAAAIKSIYENSSSGYEVRSKTAEGKGGGHCMRKNGTFAKTGSGQPHANVEKGPRPFSRSIQPERRWVAGRISTGRSCGCRLTAFRGSAPAGCGGSRRCSVRAALRLSGATCLRARRRHRRSAMASLRRTPRRVRHENERMHSLLRLTRNGLVRLELLQQPALH